MSASLPHSWAQFLWEVDATLSAPVELHCLGGFVLTALYGSTRQTHDLDLIAVAPMEKLQELEQIAGKGSDLSKKHRFHVEYVTVADVPDGYESRLIQLFADRFKKLHLLALDPYDLLLSKISRNNERDRYDVEFLVAKAKLDENVLRRRYEEELRPRFVEPIAHRHALTLRLWIESAFPKR